MKQIHIEDIASSWLSYQNLKENILKEEINNIAPTQIIDENKQYQYIKFSHSSLMKFWERITNSLMQNINEVELDIIIKLMQYLDENPNTPSIVSYCSNDSNQKYKMKKSLPMEKVHMIFWLKFLYANIVWEWLKKFSSLIITKLCSMER